MTTQRFSRVHRELTVPLLSLLLLAGCSSAASTMRANYADPSAFGRNLFLVAEEGSWRDWGAQLTPARQALGAAYIQSHHERWKKTMHDLSLAFGRPLERVDFRVVDNGLEFNDNGAWNLLFRVEKVEGAWKINQD